MSTKIKLALGILAVMSYIFVVTYLITKDVPESPEKQTDVSSYDFVKSLNMCHALGLSLHSVRSDVICVKKEDNKCAEYAVKSNVSCGDSRVKGLDDLNITFITRSMD